MFPTGLMTNARLGSVITAFKRRQSANPAPSKKQRGDVAVIDVDAENNGENSGEDIDEQAEEVDSGKKRGR